MNNQYQVTATIVLYKNNIEELKRAICTGHRTKRIKRYIE